MKTSKKYVAELGKSMIYCCRHKDGDRKWVERTISYSHGKTVFCISHREMFLTFHTERQFFLNFTVTHAVRQFLLHFRQIIFFFNFIVTHHVRQFFYVSHCESFLTFHNFTNDLFWPKLIIVLILYCKLKSLVACPVQVWILSNFGLN